MRASAERHARLVLDTVAMAEPGRILGLAVRHCPELPPTIAERITNYRARNVADWVMYRKALAAAPQQLFRMTYLPPILTAFLSEGARESRQAPMSEAKFVELSPYFCVTLTETRRFLARPSSVELSATGNCSP